MKTVIFCTLALVLGTSAASAKMHAPTDQDVLQAACYPDVQRLCKDALPDERKVTACMKGKRSMISPKCMQAYKKAHR